MLLNLTIPIQVEMERWANRFSINSPIQLKILQSNAQGAHFLNEHPGFFDAQFFNLTHAEASVDFPLILERKMLMLLGNGSTAATSFRVLLRGFGEWYAFISLFAGRKIDCF
jgi:hypothetical protein